MKITFLGNFRVDHTTENHHAATLESLGHQVIRLQETEATSDEIYTAAIESDLFVWTHTHGWQTPGDDPVDTFLRAIKHQDVLTMSYHLDLWLGLDRQKDMQADPYWNLDHFFTVDPQMAAWLNEHTNTKGHYLPAGVYDKECYRVAPEFPFDVAFVGSRLYHPEWPYRTKLVDFLAQTYGNGFRHFGADGLQVVRGEGLNHVYADARVVVGDSLCPGFNYPGYWSDRVYETLGRGGMLIHPYVPEMDKMFEDEIHLQFYEYGNFDQLKAEIDHHLVNNVGRERIRQQGHEYVKANHTYVNRWKTILEVLECGS